MHAGLDGVSTACPSVQGRLHTCYSPVRRSPPEGIATSRDAPRLACVKPVASVHPEPGSNSPLLFILFFLSFQEDSASYRAMRSVLRRPQSARCSFVCVTEPFVSFAALSPYGPDGPEDMNADLSKPSGVFSKLLELASANFTLYSKFLVLACSSLSAVAETLSLRH